MDGAFYRIRSTGTALLSGGSGTIGQDKLNNSLWKLSLKTNRDTGAAVSGAGLVSRTIEVIARPSVLFPRAITLTNSINANTAGASIDSFDSQDATKSTNGEFDIAKRQSNAKVGTLDGTGSNMNGLQIYGDLMYSGPAILGTGGVTGQIITPFYETVPPVEKPVWTTVNGSYGIATGPINLVSGPLGAPTRYKMSSIAYNSGADVMTLLPPAPGACKER